MSKKRRSLSPTILGSVCGLIVGAIFLLKFYDELAPVQVSITPSRQVIRLGTLSESVEIHTLDVRILTIWQYRKSSLDVEHLRREMMIVQLTPAVIILLLSVFFGASVFRRFDIWSHGEFQDEPPSLNTEKHEELFSPFR